MPWTSTGSCKRSAPPISRAVSHALPAIPNHKARPSRPSPTSTSSVAALDTGDADNALNRLVVGHGHPRRLHFFLPCRRRQCRRERRLRPELASVEVLVDPPLLEQLQVRAALDDLPLVDDQDLVGVADGGEAVGDDEAGPPGHIPSMSRQSMLPRP